MPDVYGDFCALLVLFLTGGVCGVLFDVMRAVTAHMHSRSRLLFAGDILFWIAVACLLSLALMLTADGQLRVVFLLAAIGGSAAYILLLSPVLFPPICLVAATMHGVMLAAGRLVMWICDLPSRSIRALEERGKTVLADWSRALPFSPALWSRPRNL